MFLSRISFFQFLTLLALFAVLGGCASKEVARPRYFWPPPPDEPKIEYLGPYMADADLRRDVDNWFADIVLGHAPPSTLLTQPFDVVSDSRGRVFVSDTAQRQVLILDLHKGEWRTLKGDPGREWLFFKTPLALSCNDQGGVFVSDMAEGKIYYFGPDEKVRYAFGHEELRRVTGLAVDDQRQRLYAVDAPSSRLFVFTLSGELQAIWGERGVAPGAFNFPLDVDLDVEGNVYVLDALNFRVQVFDPQGNYLREFGEIGKELGGFQLPKGIALDTRGQVYVTDSRAHQMLIYDTEGNLLQVVGGYRRISQEGIAPGGMNLPSGVDADANDTIWVVDTLNRAIHRFQYLNADYLRAHPIEEQDIYRPR